MTNWMTKLYRFQYNARLAAHGLRCRRTRRLAPRFDPDRPPPRIVIVLVGLLGDTVLCTPLILEARRLWPDARISVLGRSHNVALLSGCPWIDELHTTAAEPFSLRRRHRMPELEAWLRGGEFDLAIIALGDHFAAILEKVGIPVRVGLRGHRLEPCLTHSYDIGSPRTWGPWERSGALRALGLETQEVVPRLSITESARSSGRRRLLPLGLGADEPYLVIHPFGSTPAQWWPTEQVNELGRRIRRELGLTTVLIGGGETRAAVLGKADDVVDSRGALSLEELLGVIEQARLVVSTDSGPFHIAGALGRPIVGLFRARRPEHAGRYSQARVIFGCHHACKWQCQWDRCRERPCRQMRDLSATDVFSTIRGVLSHDQFSTH